MSFAGGKEQPTGTQLLREATLATTNYEGFPYAQTMANFPPAVHDVFLFDDLLTPEEKAIRYRTRAFMVRTLCATLACYFNRSQCIKRRSMFSEFHFSADLMVLAECLRY